MKKYRFFLLCCSVSLFLNNACKKDSTTTTDSLYVPTTADVTANATLEELQQGRTLYTNNCGACHGLYSPDSYSVSTWKTYLSRMVPNTNLTQAQATLVTKYVCKGKQ